MKILLAQTGIKWEEKEENILKAKEIIGYQSNRGAEVILFPEMSFTGFSMNTEVTGEENMETVGKLSVLAQNYNVFIGFGWVRKNGNRCENIYTILDNSGEILSEYVKIHPFSDSGEDKKFNGGNMVVTYNIKGIPFSTFICYDLRFPEIFRKVSNDVHGIIIPANWPQKRAGHWKTLLRARAIENQVYIFAINCQGDIGKQYYSGDSCIINPDGEVIQVISDKEGIISYDFMDDVEKYREAFPVLKDRRYDI